MKRDVLRRGDPAALVQHRPALALVFPDLAAAGGGAAAKQQLLFYLYFGGSP